MCVCVCHGPNELSVHQLSGDPVSIPGRVIPKTQKWYLKLPFLTSTL